MTATQKPPVTFVRTYDAPVADLWELWTTKTGFESWWGPQGFRVEVHELNAVVGGTIFYDMIACGEAEIGYMKAANMPLSHETRGTFTEVVPLQRLTLRHLIDFVPGYAPYENFMRVEFTETPEGTRMSIAVDAHPGDEWTKNSTQGMTSQLTKLPGALQALRQTK